MGRSGESAETAVEATGICNDLSNCTMEMYNIIQWLDTCYKAGYLSDKDTGLDISKLTLGSSFLKTFPVWSLVNGDILAEGLLQAGEKLGEEGRADFSNEVSGVGDSGTPLAQNYYKRLLYALEPGQPIAMLHE